MQGKKWIAAALVCGFLLGQGTAPAQAGILGTVVKGGRCIVIGQPVCRPAEQRYQYFDGKISYLQRLRYQGSADYYRG